MTTKNAILLASFIVLSLLYANTMDELLTLEKQNKAYEKAYMTLKAESSKFKAGHLYLWLEKEKNK